MVTKRLKALTGSRRITSVYFNAVFEKHSHNITISKIQDEKSSYILISIYEMYILHSPRFIPAKTCWVFWKSLLVCSWAHNSPIYLPINDNFAHFFPFQLIITRFWSCTVWSLLYHCTPSSPPSERWAEKCKTERIFKQILDILGRQIRISCVKFLKEKGNADFVTRMQQTKSITGKGCIPETRFSFKMLLFLQSQAYKHSTWANVHLVFETRGIRVLLSAAVSKFAVPNIQ